MTLEWIKNPRLQEIVSAQHSDFQVSNAVDWISKYDGVDVFKDFLSEVPFDITEDNRENYWDIVFNLTPMTKDQAENAWIKAKREEIDLESSPMEKAFKLIDVQSVGNDRISEEFKEQTDAINGFLTADSLHKSQVAFKKDTSAKVAKIFSDPNSLDALVSEPTHRRDLMEIIRYDRLDNALIHNGRLSVKDTDNNITIGSNIGIGLEQTNMPSAQEQLEVQRLSYLAAKPHIKTKLDMSRVEWIKSKRTADEALFESATSGRLSRDDSIAATVNMLSYENRNISKYTGQAMGGVLKNTAPHDMKREAGKFVGGLLTTLSKRGKLA